MRHAIDRALFALAHETREAVTAAARVDRMVRAIAERRGVPMPPPADGEPVRESVPDYA